MHDNSYMVDVKVYAKDFPETRLMAGVDMADLTPSALDALVAKVARNMWGANCHYGFVFTPTTTYVLRDDFTAHGPAAIRVTETVPTAKLLGRMGRQVAEATSEYHFKRLVRDWLELLAKDYDAALPDDPDISNILFPQIVSEVAEGRVVAEVSFL